MGLSPQARKLRARQGAYAQHAKYDTRETTAAARLAFRESFAAKVRAEHPELGEPEVQRRADAARRAWYSGIALKSAVVRARRTRLRMNSPAGSGLVDTPAPDPI